MSKDYVDVLLEEYLGDDTPEVDESEPTLPGEDGEEYE